MKRQFTYSQGTFLIPALSLPTCEEELEKAFSLHPKTESLVKEKGLLGGKQEAIFLGHTYPETVSGSAILGLGLAESWMGDAQRIQLSYIFFLTKCTTL